MKNPTETTAFPRWLRRAAALEPGPAVGVTVDGVALEVRPGDSVAAAVLLAGHAAYRRTIIGDMARAPFCMMGVCFECLVEIDGIPNQQGCITLVQDGMRIVRQLGLRAVEGGEP